MRAPVVVDLFCFVFMCRLIGSESANETSSSAEGSLESRRLRRTQSQRRCSRCPGNASGALTFNSNASAVEDFCF
jgi:hypothetical protein